MCPPLLPQLPSLLPLLKSMLPLQSLMQSLIPLRSTGCASPQGGAIRGQRGTCVWLSPGLVSIFFHITLFPLFPSFGFVNSTFVNRNLTVEEVEKAIHVRGDAYTLHVSTKILLHSWSYGHIICQRFKILTKNNIFILKDCASVFTRFLHLTGPG